MPTDLSIDDHLDGIAAAVSRGAQAARGAGLDAPVVTCGRWDVRHLVAHVGMVHRWAAAHLEGRAAEIGSGAELAATGRQVADPIGWWVDGADELIATLRTVDDDVPAMVFLNDAPRPRRFWARRQCHEATIHAVDAQAALFGRPPSATESEIADAVALDGLDELLGGFLTRGAKMAVASPRRLLVRPDGDLGSWTIALSEGSAVTTRHPPGVDADADEVLTGSAVALYLGLWNRGDDLTAPSETLAWWRKVARIRWS